MVKLPPDAAELLARARAAHDPTPAQRASADAMLRAALRRHGIQDLPQPTAAGPSGAALDGRSSLRGLLRTQPARWVVGLVALSGAVAIGVLGVDARRSTRAPASQVPVVTPASQPDRLRDAAVAPRVLPAPAAPIEVLPHVEAQPVRVPRASRGVAGSPARVASASLSAELRLIAQVDAHLRSGEYRQALGLLGAPAVASRSSKLHEERQALRVIALCGLSADARALRERERFLRSAPSSVLAARVRGACAGAQP